jgi:hypothetical protein
MRPGTPPGKSVLDGSRMRGHFAKLFVYAAQTSRESDTAGYNSGAIQGRWTECTANPIPSIRKVALAAVRKYLPAKTPVVTVDQRDRLVRERRSQVQQRALW